MKMVAILDLILSLLPDKLLSFIDLTKEMYRIYSWIPTSTYALCTLHHGSFIEKGTGELHTKNKSPIRCSGVVCKTH